jgi:endonuclease/exonuclease/phosphatase family metal-dependent hydrolase
VTSIQLIRALAWNLYHGRDHPPNRALNTWRSRILRISERDETHVQVNRDLYDEFMGVICGRRWDVCLLQECPPRWAHRLARDCGAEEHRVLTSRNSLAPLRTLLAILNPDLIASNEGGSNLTLVRGDSIAERRELVLRERTPERRTMAFTRLSRGLCVANLHASNAQPPLPVEEVLLAAERATEWAGDLPLLLGGDFNVRPARVPDVFEELERRFGLRSPTAPDSIDHLLARGLEIVESPRAWPDEKREVPADGRRIRLSDHAPVEAVFAMPAGRPELG